MKQSASNRKVNEQAREVIASILLFDVSDPRLHLVTITGCEVSYDRSVCNVYYTTDPERYAGAQAAFEAAAGHIRSLMAKKLSWRVAPELRFYVDTSVDQAEAISQALNSEREHQEKRIEEEIIGEDREYEFHDGDAPDQHDAFRDRLRARRARPLRHRRPCEPRR